MLSWLKSRNYHTYSWMLNPLMFTNVTPLVDNWQGYGRFMMSVWGQDRKRNPKLQNCANHEVNFFFLNPNKYADLVCMRHGCTHMQDLLTLLVWYPWKLEILKHFTLQGELIDMNPCPNVQFAYIHIYDKTPIIIRIIASWVAPYG